MGIPQFYGTAEDAEQGEEHRNLDQHGQTATQRIDLVVAIERHGLLLELLGLVLIFFLQGLDLWLELLHALHAFRTLMGQRPEQDTHDQGQQDNGDPVIGNHPIQLVQAPQQGFTNPSEYPEFHDFLLVQTQWCNRGDFLGPHIITKGAGINLFGVQAPGSKLDGRGHTARNGGLHPGGRILGILKLALGPLHHQVASTGAIFRIQDLDKEFILHSNPVHTALDGRTDRKGQHLGHGSASHTPFPATARVLEIISEDKVIREPALVPPMPNSLATCGGGG